MIETSLLLPFDVQSLFESLCAYARLVDEEALHVVPFIKIVSDITHIVIITSTYQAIAYLYVLLWAVVIP